MFAPFFWKKMKNLFLEKCLTIENPQNHQMITEFAKKTAETTIKRLK